MRISAIYVFLSLLLFAVPGWGQPPPLIKKGERLVPALPPDFYQAKATKVKGKVVVQLSGPSLRTMKKNDAQAKDVYVWVRVWEDMKPLTLGKEVKAYSPAGKPLSKEAVLKALAKKAPVVCFVRKQPDDPMQPDPFYAALFRNDAVLLVFDYKNLWR